MLGAVGVWDTVRAGGIDSTKESDAVAGTVWDALSVFVNQEKKIQTGVTKAIKKIKFPRNFRFLTSPHDFETL